ncbi:MAG: hypothetical protein V4563_14245 [Pseudomonadota bacterium]
MSQEMVLQETHETAATPEPKKNLPHLAPYQWTRETAAAARLKGLEVRKRKIQALALLTQMETTKQVMVQEQIAATRKALLKPGLKPSDRKTLVSVLGDLFRLMADDKPEKPRPGSGPAAVEPIV